MSVLKHTVQIKLPKIFGRKKEEGPEVTTEIHLEDSIIDLQKALKVAAPFAATLAVGYLIGNNRGLKKALEAERRR